GGKVARLDFGPAPSNKPEVLELEYLLSPGRVGGSSLLFTTLYAPRLRGDLGQAPVRWSVNLPPGWVPLYQEGSFAPEHVWGWRGWLLAPRPAAGGADLERWFAGHEAVSRGDEEAPALPSVVCWRATLGPMTLYHAPQQAWLLACSLTLLVVGLAPYFVALPPPPFWLAVVLLRRGPAGGRV